MVTVEDIKKAQKILNAAGCKGEPWTFCDLCGDFVLVASGSFFAVEGECFFCCEECTHLVC